MRMCVNECVRHLVVACVFGDVFEVSYELAFVFCRQSAAHSQHVRGIGYRIYICVWGVCKCV